MKPHRSSRSGQSIRIKPLRVFVALALVALAFHVGATSFAYAVRQRNLGLASSLAPNNASILALTAQKWLEAGKPRRAEAVALSAIAQDPTLVGAVATLGISRQVSGDTVAASKLQDYALYLSRRNLQANLWAIENAVAREDITAALRYYDYALRTSVRSREILFPILGNVIDDPQIAPKLLARLKQRPLWWDAFLYHVAAEPSVPPRKATGFLLHARKAGVNAPAASLVTLVHRSIDAGQPPVAWQAYTLTQPGADRRRSRDPVFARGPNSPTLFDWALTNEGGINAQISKGQGSTGELSVGVGPGAAGKVIEQLQFLPQGAYRLIVSTSQADLAGGNLTWNVTCGDGQELARLIIGRTGSASSPPFRVPGQCNTQWVRLIASPSDAIEGMEGKFVRVEVVPAA